MPRPNKLHKYLDELKKYYFKHNTLPNFEILKDIFWVKSKGSITNIFDKLLNLGYLKKEWNKFFVTQKFTSFDLFESVRAWFPSPWTDENKTHLNLQEFLIENPHSTFFLKVKGDSMKEAWIMEWDIVIVDKSKKVKDWDIVIGLIDWEFTLKYYEKKDGKICLVPANPNYPILYPTQQLEIFWIVCWLVRKY